MKTETDINANIELNHNVHGNKKCAENDYIRGWLEALKWVKE